MDQQPPDQPDDNNLPQIPDDISGLEQDVRDREVQRRKALEVALEKAKSATSQEEKDFWIVKAMEFGDILEQYKGLYPELLSDINPDDGTQPPNQV